MLKLIAPFRAMFNLNSSLVAANPESYNQFLLALQKDLADASGKIRSQLTHQPDISVNLMEKTSEIESRFVTIKKSGSLFAMPHIISLSFVNLPDIQAVYRQAMEEADKTIAKHSDVFEANLETLRVDIHDNTIAILSLELSINRKQLDGTNPAAWDSLDEWTTSLMFYLLKGLYQTHIYPVLSAITQFSATNGYDIIRLPSQYKIFSDLTQGITADDYNKRFLLMWVNRTLCYFQDYPANNWIKALVRHAISPSEAEVHINQGNCVITLPQNYNRNKMQSFWNVAYPAQYYYAAMDVMNINLMKYIGISFDSKNSKKLRQTQADIEDIVNKVTLLQAKYSDLTLEMQGVANKIFDVLQQEWYFSSLVDSVQKKLELCKVNIDALHQMRLERMINSLLGIGIIVVLLQIIALAVH